MAVSTRIGPPRPGPRPKLQSTEMMALDGNLEDRQAMYDALETFVAEIKAKWGAESPLALMLSPRLMRWLADQMEQHKVPNIYDIAEHYRAEAIANVQRAETLAKERGDLEARLATLNQRHSLEIERVEQRAMETRKGICQMLTSAASILGEEFKQFEAYDGAIMHSEAHTRTLRGLVSLRALIADAWMKGQTLTADELRDAINEISPDPAAALGYVEADLKTYVNMRARREERAPGIQAAVTEWQEIGTRDLRTILGENTPDPKPEGRVVEGEVHIQVRRTWPTPVAQAPDPQSGPDIFDQPTNGVPAAFSGD